MTFSSLTTWSLCCHLAFLSIPPPPLLLLFLPHLHPSFLHSRSDSGSAVTTSSPSHASAVRPGFVTGGVGVAGRVRYLTARTSWLGIYADDDSHCPLAILLLPLRWSVQSSDIGMIAILLWSTVSLCFSFTLSLSPPLLKDFWVTIISERDFANFRSHLCVCHSAKFTVTSGLKFKKVGINCFWSQQ